MPKAAHEVVVKRRVTLVHKFGGTKAGLVGTLDMSQQPKTAKVHVAWDLHGLLIFSAASGYEHGRPRGPWRVSDDDVAAFCEALKIKPIVRKVSPLKERKPKPEKHDPRQLSLVSK